MSNDWKREHGSLPDNWHPTRPELERHRYFLRCDAPACTECSPPSDAVYFETGGERMARAIAEQHGWARVSIDGISRDLCPFHVGTFALLRRAQP